METFLTTLVIILCLIYLLIRPSKKEIDIPNEEGKLPKDYGY